MLLVAGRPAGGGARTVNPMFLRKNHRVARAVARWRADGLRTALCVSIAPKIISGRNPARQRRFSLWSRV